MSLRTPRRGFLTTTTGLGLAAGLGDLGFLGRLNPVRAADAVLPGGKVQFAPELEPLVQLIEDTPRERTLEEVAGRIKAGASYREVLAALLLAGVRNVQPRPSVGFKFHAVLVVNSAHLASLASPDEHRWLPIFWALDQFKESQAEDVSQNNWTMAAVDEAQIPSPLNAVDEFSKAMEDWDESRADVATAGLVRAVGANKIFDLFCALGARDFRDIGHKAIYVANSWRTLSCIGWQHAEPVLRSLAYALTHHEGSNPATSDQDADRPGRENTERLARIRSGWQNGQLDDGATRELLAALRHDNSSVVCELVVEQLNRQIAPQSIWDGLFVGASELLARQAGIVSLHAVTTTNALHFAFRQTSDDAARRLLLLQNAAFLPLFREAMRGRGSLETVDLAAIESQPVTADAPAALEETLGQMSDKPAAMRTALGYLQAGHSPRDLLAAFQLLIFLKGNNSHDYKFSSAVFEDHGHLSPGWRDRFLAASVHNLRGPQSEDNPLVTRIRAALS